MSKKLVSLFLAALMVFGMTAALAESTGITVTDMHGREITLSEPATRIVAVQPSDCVIIPRPSRACPQFSPAPTPTLKRFWP